jgi:hypothetical protein
LERERDGQWRRYGGMYVLQFINIISLGIGYEYIFMALLEGFRDEWNVKDGFSYFIVFQSSEGLISLALNSTLNKI